MKAAHFSMLDAAAESLRALFDHRLRTALSVLGIMIGIAAVMAVSTISKGGNYIVFSELETFGLNSIWIYRDERDESLFSARRPGTGIDNDDLQELSQRRAELGILRVTPLVYPGERGWVAKRGGRVTRADISGAGIEYVSIVNDDITAGRNFLSTDVRQRHAVVLLAPDVASRLFEPGENALGQSIRIRQKSFTVIGLLAGKSRDFLSSIGSAGGQNANDRIVIPFTTLQSMNDDRSIGTLQLEAREFDEAAAASERVTALLAQRNEGQYAYGAETMASYVQTTNRILDGVAIVGVVAASISLLVGGMGIMNIMSTAVLERTREIGIRKAIGASERDILLQFLLEAALISITGGALGLLIGSALSIALALLTGFPLVPSALAIAGAMVVSVGVGLLSGLLPARRASRLAPVEALRTD